MANGWVFLTSRLRGCKARVLFFFSSEYQLEFSESCFPAFPKPATAELSACHEEYPGKCLPAEERRGEVEDPSGWNHYLPRVSSWRFSGHTNQKFRHNSTTPRTLKGSLCFTSNENCFTRRKKYFSNVFVVERKRWIKARTLGIEVTEARYFANLESKPCTLKRN